MGNCNGCPFLFQQCVWRSARISPRGDRALRFSAADRGSTVRFGTVVGCADGFTVSHARRRSKAQATRPSRHTQPAALRLDGSREHPQHVGAAVAAASPQRPSVAGLCAGPLVRLETNPARRAVAAQHWEFALDTIELVARAAEDDAPVSLISEIRLRERTLGTTWDARLSQRIRYVALTTDDGPVARD